MYNWSTDTDNLEKDPQRYTIWKLEQMVNFGLGGERINTAALREHLPVLEIDPARRRYLEFLLE